MFIQCGPECSACIEPANIYPPEGKIVHNYSLIHLPIYSDSRSKPWRPAEARHTVAAFLCSEVSAILYFLRHGNSHNIPFILWSCILDLSSILMQHEPRRRPSIRPNTRCNPSLARRIRPHGTSHGAHGRRTLRCR